MKKMIAIIFLALVLCGQLIVECIQRKPHYGKMFLSTAELLAFIAILENV